VLGLGETPGSRLRRILKDLGGVGLPLYVVVTGIGWRPVADHLSDLRRGRRRRWWLWSPVAFGDDVSQDLINDRVDYLRSVGRGPTGDRFALISLTACQERRCSRFGLRCAQRGAASMLTLFSLVAADDGAAVLCCARGP